jgi:hypothetical protein
MKMKYGNDTVWICSWVAIQKMEAGKLFLKYGVLSTLAFDDEEARNMFERKVTEFSDLEGFELKLSDPVEIDIDTEKIL